jgi:putative membrane protein insertion efficiency factor
LIIIYQKTVSPDHGLLKRAFKYGYCRFQPTCSDYGFEAIWKYGMILGGLMAIERIFRCNPWNDGGHDPLK